jgi:DNA repair protein RadA/Sms
MAKSRVIYRCADCGAHEAKWSGRCSACGAWNAVHEQVSDPEPAYPGAAGWAPSAPPMPIDQVDTATSLPVPTGISELDRVLGGGLVPGSVTLLGGEPGIGKSTLLLQLLGAQPTRTLYVSAEESAQQVRARAGRLAVLRPSLWLVAETSLSAIIAAIDQTQPDVVVIDSIQAIADTDLSAAPGSVTQVRDCAHRLVHEAKRRSISIVLVGHVTKDGSLAGPRVLEHVVDTVLSFEGERHHALRLLRAVKHRYGTTNELGLFEMTATGLVAVPDPSRLFLADRRNGVPGSVVLPALDGQRPLLVEIQALVVPGNQAMPRRVAQGFDQTRLPLLLAVLAQRAGCSFSGADVYVSVVGGVRLSDPGADLAVCLAVASALLDLPLPNGTVACGEVGLGGELRQVAQTPRRLAEAARLGFDTGIVADTAAHRIDGMRVRRISSLAEAIGMLLPTDAARPAAARPAALPQPAKRPSPDRETEPFGAHLAVVASACH